ncbi:universal stress protein [Haloglomus litoreum]|uniref:universal stress protein n=1 Tax=Haloglomus litoreum TaxID=3034026 RepID=UPI0023E86433|nr:universal stress protein [Haloglomus sp. DT116]
MVVLVPIDDSDPAWTALELAVEAFPGTLLVVHVVDPLRALATHGSRGLDGAMDAAQHDAERILAAATAHADSRGVATETEVAFGDPARTILEYAALDEVDHVVIGSHGRTGVGRILLGSVAETVLRRSPVPVTVAR